MKTELHEMSGIEQLNKQFSRPMPPMINRAGMFALGMVVGALVVAIVVVLISAFQNFSFQIFHP